MTKTKQFCTTHHLFYTSEHCPMCVKDHLEKLEQKHNKIPVFQEDRLNISRTIALAHHRRNKETL